MTVPYLDRLRRAYQVFQNKDDTPILANTISSFNTAYNQYWRDSASRVLEPIISRISIDAASIQMKHIRNGNNGGYLEIIDGELNDRLSLKANIDQTSFAFFQDLYITMMCSGTAVIAPTYATDNPKYTSNYEILAWRVGTVSRWYNRSVELNLYNEATGQQEQVVLDKREVAIVYNPMRLVMNQPNSTLRRLIDKRALLDMVDKKTGNQKLDLILQLPFPVKRAQQQVLAQQRLDSIEQQLKNSAFGIAYVGATEHITQLNRPVVNNLAEQVANLTKQLNYELGLTEKILDGTATSEETIAYYHRTIEPLIETTILSLKSTFLTRTARTQGQDIRGFMPLFKLAPVEVLADSLYKLSTAAIVSTNEARGVLGLPQRDDNEDYNALRNKGMPLDASLPPSSNQSTDSTK